MAGKFSARAALKAAKNFLPEADGVEKGGEAPRSDAFAVLTRRADFLSANRGLRVARPGFVLLAHPNQGQGMRYGITVTKKIGNAVVRNRMKRRFRELLHDALPGEGLADHDHVLIGREGGIERDFTRLRQELTRALAKANAGEGDPPRKRSGGRFGKNRGKNVRNKAK